jgi:hypothetical protein
LDIPLIMLVASILKCASTSTSPTYNF